MSSLLYPWASSLKNKQIQESGKYNDRFDSYVLLTGLLEHIKGRGNNPEIKREVDELKNKITHESNIEILPSSSPNADNIINKLKGSLGTNAEFG